jgi:spore maturation protein CgeB
MNGRRITSEECVKIFNASKINLNLHSSVGVEELVSKGDFVNPRTFEVAACSGFQLVDERGLLHECFAPDELATFTSLPELKEKMEYFLAHPEEREAIARRGRERVLREHTYAHRMERLLDFTAERLSGWPRPRQGAEAAQGLPPELAEEIGALVSGLGLPADVSFADLVWALRQRSGALSDMETAVLFLDEWRKTYVKDAS